MIGTLVADIVNAIIPLVVIIGLFLLLYALIRYESARPYLVVVFCLVTIASGVYSTITAVDYYSAVSETRGSFEEVDPYADFNVYDLEVEGIAFNKDKETGTYYLQKTYNTHIEFNGTNENFVTLVNNRPCYATQSNAGQLNAKTQFYVKDVDGQFMTSIDMTVHFTFYANEIQLLISTNATDDNIHLLQQYCQINGLHIQILDDIYLSYNILTGQTV